MNRVLRLLPVAAVAVAITACSASRGKQPAAETSDVTAMKSPVIGSPAVMPKAVIYTTSGDYDDCVPVTLSADGRQVVSYPAPGDVSPERSTPLKVAEGFLLDRRGVGMHTAFTRYTYAQYAALPAAPSPAVLLDSVIPGARVTTMYELPVTAAEAAADTALVNSLIREGRFTPLMPQRVRPTNL